MADRTQPPSELNLSEAVGKAIDAATGYFLPRDTVMRAARAAIGVTRATLPDGIELTDAMIERWKADLYLDLNERRNPGTDEFAKGFNGGMIEARDTIYAKLPQLILAMRAAAPDQSDAA